MKYFCVSDIHSFAVELKEALKKAGFNKRNPDHVLIVLGDLFDRGPDAKAVYKFITSIPKSRRILIKGNHEDLYFQLLNKKYPEEHDFANHTVDTFCQIADEEHIDDITTEEYLKDNYYFKAGMFADYCKIEPEAQKTWDRIKQKVADSPITKWLRSDEWINFYELDKYIFVHSFIPSKLKEEAYTKFGVNAYFINNPEWFEYNANWRTEMDWYQAVWGCPWKKYQQDLFKEESEKGKVLVCGHWHTSDFFKHLKDIYTDDTTIYFSKDLIAIDGGVKYDYYYSILVHDQNVLVIENGECFDKYGDKLVEIEAAPIIETVSESDLR